MILEHVVKGQTLAVENKDYKNIIEEVLVSIEAPLFASMNNFERQTCC
jgi:hypothetical protein